MKLYTIQVKCGYGGNTVKILKVAAKSPKAALELVESHAKKNYYADPRIVFIQEELAIDLIQK